MPANLVFVHIHTHIGLPYFSVLAYMYCIHLHLHVQYLYIIATDHSPLPLSSCGGTQKKKAHLSQCLIGISRMCLTAQEEKKKAEMKEASARLSAGRWLITPSANTSNLSICLYNGESIPTFFQPSKKLSSHAHTRAEPRTRTPYQYSYSQKMLVTGSLRHGCVRPYRYLYRQRPEDTLCDA